MTRERQLAYWGIGFAIFLVVLFLLRDILLPFVLGMAVAYFVDPIADRLERWGLARWLAATVLTIGFLIAVAAFLLLLAPLLKAQFVELLSRLPDYAELIRQQANALIEVVAARLSDEEVAQLRKAIGGLAGKSLAWLGDMTIGLWSGGLALLNVLSLILITPIVTFYILRDWDVIVARIDGWLPREHAATIRAQVREIDRTLAGFARGQALVCMMLGAFYAAGLTLVGLDFGLIVGLGTGLISFVPYFGMLIGLIASVGLAVSQFDDVTRIVIVAAIFFIGQIVEGNVVTPKLVGDRVGLHPVWMIFALLAGGALFGFLGLLLAVPAAAAIGVLARFALEGYQASYLYRGPESPGEGDGGP